MFRPLPFFIGLRYTRAKRRNHFISFISLISMLGLTLGVMVMILVLSVMNGFDRELRTRILGMVPHATINGYQPISDWQSLAERFEQNPKVVGTAPFIQLQGMLTHNGSVAPVLVNGIEPQAEKRVSILENHMRLNMKMVTVEKEAKSLICPCRTRMSPALLSRTPLTHMRHVPQRSLVEHRQSMERNL